jgi:hypothetical protein
MSKFEDNGGYYIDGVPYMDCKYTGIPVKNVSTDATSVISDQALQSRMYKMFPEDYEEKTKQYKPTGRPAGWHFMNEFEGKEQPELKGTLPPTKVKAKKKTKRRTKDEILVARHKEKLAAERKLKKDLDKQKKFLMGEVDK